MEATLNEKAMCGISKFLKRRGMEIIEEGWAHGKDKIDFVIEDEDELVFVACKIRENEGNGLGREEIDRKMFERIAAAYLAEHFDAPESTVRFDVVTMLRDCGRFSTLFFHTLTSGTCPNNQICNPVFGSQAKYQEGQKGC